MLTIKNIPFIFLDHMSAKAKLYIFNSKVKIVK